MKFLKKMFGPSGDPRLNVYLSEFRREIDQLVASRDIELDGVEDRPPWLNCKYPFYIEETSTENQEEPLDGHARAFWTIGPGGKVWADFLEFWIALPLSEKLDYFKKYDLGPEWKERWVWWNNLFDLESLNFSEEQERQMDKFIDRL